jgi:hypothetical protein
MDLGFHVPFTSWAEGTFFWKLQAESCKLQVVATPDKPASKMLNTACSL